MRFRGLPKLQLTRRSLQDVISVGCDVPPYFRRAGVAQGNRDGGYQSFTAPLSCWNATLYGVRSPS